jgi:SAM-dependent methyltransferase
MIHFLSPHQAPSSVEGVAPRCSSQEDRLRSVFQPIEQEALSWRGHTPEICVPHPIPPLNGPCERREWWGRVARLDRAFGLVNVLRQYERILKQKNNPIAVDIGCGNSVSTIFLLQKGWRVICVDYAHGALDALAKQASQINQEWLRTGRLTLCCSAIESYEWPHEVDLILASSSLPYCNPRSIQEISGRIHAALVSGGHFVGNLFAANAFQGSFGQAIKRPMSAMGAWYIRDQESVCSLLNVQGYRIVACKQGEGGPFSVAFVAKKG